MRPLFVLIILSILITACGAQPENNNTAQAAAQVVTSTPIPTAPAAARPTYTVQRGTVQEDYTFTGRWRPRDQMELSFEIQGTISAIYVNRGDAISAGDILAQFDTTDLQDQLASAQIQLDTAIANQESEGEGGIEAVEDAEINLANSRLSLEDRENSLPWTSVASARLQLEAAERDLFDAQREYQEAISHPEQSADVVDSAYQQLRNAEDAVKSAEYNYFSAAQSYNSSVIGVQQQENSVIQSELNRDRAVASAQGVQDADVRSAQLSVDQIIADIQRSTLYAPMDGVVLEVAVSAGDAVGAFEVVIIIGIPEPKEVIATLPFADTQRLSVGMTGACQLANQPETAVGCIVRQIPLSNQDADQTTRVAASLENVPDGQLVEVILPLDVRGDVLWLPPAAIRTFQNRVFVVVQTPEGPRAVDVEIGLETDDRVEIISGVNEGDVVEGP